MRIEQVLQQINVTEQEKNVILARILPDISSFSRRTRSLYLFYQSLRILVLSGSVMMPALLFTVATQIAVEQREPVFWLCFATSVTVGMSNAVLEGFSISRKYYESLATSESFEREFWSFITMTGRYARYTSHINAWKKFVSVFDRIKAKNVEATLLPSNSGVFNTGIAISIFNDLQQSPPPAEGSNSSPV